MRDRRDWLHAKLAAVPDNIRTEVELSADIIIRIDRLLKEKGMTQRDLARKMGRSEAVISRWTTGLPNLTLKTIAEISAAIGEPLIEVAGSGSYRNIQESAYQESPMIACEP